MIANSDSKSVDGSDGPAGTDILLLRRIGAGFNSAYWVFDNIQSVSEDNDGEQYVRSSSVGSFRLVQKDTAFVHGESKWGTKICCYSNEGEQSKFLEERRLNDLINEFIGFPIQLHAEKLTEMDASSREAEEEGREDDKKEAEEMWGAPRLTKTTITWAERAKLVQTQPVPQPRRPRQVGPLRVQPSRSRRITRKPKRNTTFVVPRRQMAKNLWSAPQPYDEKNRSRNKYTRPTKKRPRSVFIQMGRLLIESAANDAESDVDEEEAEKGCFDSIPPTKKTPKKKKSARVLRTMGKTSDVFSNILHSVAGAFVLLLQNTFHFAEELRKSLFCLLTFSHPTFVSKLKNDALKNVNQGKVCMRRRRHGHRNSKMKKIDLMVLFLVVGTCALISQSVAFSPPHSAMTNTISFSQISSSRDAWFGCSPYRPATTVATFTPGPTAAGGSCQLAPDHLLPFNGSQCSCAISPLACSICSDSFHAGVGDFTSIPPELLVAIVSNCTASRPHQGSAGPVGCLDDYNCTFFETGVVACTDEKLLRQNFPWSGAVWTSACTPMEEKATCREAIPSVWMRRSTACQVSVCMYGLMTGNSVCAYACKYVSKYVSLPVCVYVWYMSSARQVDGRQFRLCVCEYGKGQGISRVPGWRGNNVPFTIPLIDRPWLSSNLAVQFTRGFGEISKGFSSVVNQDYCTRWASNSSWKLSRIPQSTEDKKWIADIGSEKWRLPERAGLYKEWIIEGMHVVDAGSIRCFISPDSVSLYFPDYCKSRKVSGYQGLHEAVLESRDQINCKQIVCGLLFSKNQAFTTRQGKLVFYFLDVEYTCDAEQSLDTDLQGVKRVKYSVECHANEKFRGTTECKRVSCEVTEALRRGGVPAGLVASVALWKRSSTRRASGEVVYQDEVTCMGNERHPLSEAATGLQDFVVQCFAESELVVMKQCKEMTCFDNKPRVVHTVSVTECVKKSIFVQDACGARNTFNSDSSGETKFTMERGANGPFEQKGVENPNDNEACEKAKFGEVATVDGKMGPEELVGSKCQKDRFFTSADEKCNPASCATPKEFRRLQPESTDEKYCEKGVMGKCNGAFSVNGALFGETTLTRTCPSDRNLSSLGDCEDIEYCQKNLCRLGTSCFDFSLTNKWNDGGYGLAFMQRRSNVSPKGTCKGVCYPGYEMEAIVVEELMSWFTCWEDDSAESNYRTGGLCIFLSDEVEESTLSRMCNYSGYLIGEAVGSEGDVGLRADIECEYENRPLEKPFWDKECVVSDETPLATTPMEACGIVPYRSDHGFCTESDIDEGFFEWTASGLVAGVAEGMRECSAVQCDNYFPPASFHVTTAASAESYEYGDEMHIVNSSAIGNSSYTARFQADRAVTEGQECHPISCGKPSMLPAAALMAWQDLHSGKDGILDVWVNWYEFDNQKTAVTESWKARCHSETENEFPASFHVTTAVTAEYYEYEDEMHIVNSSAIGNSSYHARFQADRAVTEGRECHPISCGKPSMLPVAALMASQELHYGKDGILDVWVNGYEFDNQKTAVTESWKARYQLETENEFPGTWCEGCRARSLDTPAPIDGARITRIVTAAGQGAVEAQNHLHRRVAVHTDEEDSEDTDVSLDEGVHNQCHAGHSLNGQSDGVIQFAPTCLADGFQSPKICAKIFFALAETVVRDNFDRYNSHVTFQGDKGRSLAFDVRGRMASEQTIPFGNYTLEARADGCIAKAAQEERGDGAPQSVRQVLPPERGELKEEADLQLVRANMSKIIIAWILTCFSFFMALGAGAHQGSRRRRRLSRGQGVDNKVSRRPSSLGICQVMSLLLYAQVTEVHTSTQPGVNLCKNQNCELGTLAADALLQTCGDACDFAVMRQEDVSSNKWSGANIATVDQTGPELYTLLNEGLGKEQGTGKFLSLSSNMRVGVGSDGGVKWIQYRSRYDGCSGFTKITDDDTYTVAILTTQLGTFGVDDGGIPVATPFALVSTITDLWQSASRYHDVTVSPHCGSRSTSVDVKNATGDENFQFALTQCSVIFSDDNVDHSEDLNSWCGLSAVVGHLQDQSLQPSPRVLTEGTQCEKPYIDPPDCETPYPEAVVCVFPIVTVLSVWLLFLIFRVARSLCRISRYGLPSTIEAYQVLLVAYGFIALLPVTCNPRALVRGGPLGAVSNACARLSAAAVIPAALVLPLLAVRKIQTIVEGGQHLPVYELKGLVALIGTTCCLGIPAAIMEVLYVNGLAELSTYNATQVCTWGSFGIACFFSSGVGLIFLQRVKGSAIYTLLRPYFIMFIFGGLYAIFSMQQAISLVPIKNPYEVESIETANIDFFSSVFILVMLFTAATCVVGAVTHKAEMQESVQEDQWALIGGLMLFLALFCGSILLPCAAAEVLLVASTLCVPGIFCSVFVRGAPRAEDLEDFSVAMRLNKGTTNWELSKYYFAPAVEMLCDFALFSSVGFKATVPWSPSAPVSKFAVFESFQEMVTSDPKVRSTLLTSILAGYYLWGAVTVAAFFFPITHPKLKSAYTWISFVLYVPLFLSLTRIFLLGVQCHEGELIWDATPCDQAERHQMWIIVVLQGVTWFMGVAAMCYADLSQREYDPYVVTNPIVDHMSLFLRLCFLVASAYVEGHAMLIFGLILTGVLIGVEVYNPKFIGLPGLNGTRIAFICGAAEVSVTALINFVAPHSWVGFILMCLLLGPSAYAGYRIGRARTATSVVDKLFADAKKMMDLTQTNPAPRALGCVMHTQDFRKHLQECLGDGVEEPRKVHSEIDTNVDILDHLQIGLGTLCGRRAMEKYPGAVRSLVPMVSKYPDKALPVLLKLASVTSLLPLLREQAMGEVIDAWLSTRGELQEIAAEVISRIRGGERIVVHYGDRFSGVRRVDVPRGAVWLVPNCPAVSDSELVDAILAFPPTTAFPPTLPNVHRLLVPTLEFDEFEPLAPPARPFARRRSSLKNMVLEWLSVATHDPPKLWILFRVAEGAIPDEKALREAFAAFYLGRLTPWVRNA